MVCNGLQWSAMLLEASNSQENAQVHRIVWQGLDIQQQETHDKVAKQGGSPRRMTIQHQKQCILYRKLRDIFESSPKLNWSRKYH